MPDDACPAWPPNRTNCVVQPPASAMCGKYRAEPGVAAFSLTGGVVEIRKSPRSLYRLRSPATDTGVGLDKRSTPLNGACSEPNPSIWLRNSADCPFAGSCPAHWPGFSSFFRFAAIALSSFAASRSFSRPIASLPTIRSSRDIT